MRILLDENIPVDLAAELVGPEVATVAGAGWMGVSNSRLLSRASGRYDAFITMDRNIQHQQNVAALLFGVILLRAPSNRLIHLKTPVPAILDALTTLVPAEMVTVGA